MADLEGGKPLFQSWWQGKVGLVGSQSVPGVAEPGVGGLLVGVGMTYFRLEMEYCMAWAGVVDGVEQLIDIVGDGDVGF